MLSAAGESALHAAGRSGLPKASDGFLVSWTYLRDFVKVQANMDPRNDGFSLEFPFPGLPPFSGSMFIFGSIGKYKD